jgi:pimeloyl-ACP methyl ester carboxylesterase
MFTDGTLFSPVASRLAAERTLLVIDPPGFGSSDPLTRRSSIRECSTVAIEILEAFGCTGPVDWVGTAWGGHVGMDLAVYFPERVRTLAAIGTPTQPSSSRALLSVLRTLVRVAGPIAPVRAAVMGALLTDANRADPAIRDVVDASLRRATRRSLSLALSSFILARVDVEPSLASVTAPTLLVATPDRAELLVVDAERVAASMPQARLAVIDGARALVPLEQPELLADELVDFWRDGR